MISAFRQICPVHILPLKNSLDFFSIFKLAKIIKKDRVDIVHIHNGREGWIALFATRLAGRGKVVYTLHTLTHAKRDLAHRWFYNRLAKVICVSKMVQQEFLTSAPFLLMGKVSVVYNGIDTATLQNGCKHTLRRELQVPEEDFLIGYVGRISPEKGLEFLIRTLALLPNTGKKFHLVLVGEGDPFDHADYPDKLRQEIQKLNLNQAVHFYGFTKQIANVMQAIDCLVLPCIWREAFGLVLCEAMVCQKPVITTTTGAQAEVVADGESGLLVPGGSAEALAKALETILRDETLAERMGQKGRQTVLKRFTLEQMAANTAECFYSVVS
jgi:glycosyltransferase involved in cell wall biosynthesis